MTSPEQFNCLFCQESFENKEELQIHFRKHGDPKFNQSGKSSKGKGPSEMAASGEKEEAEMVQCDVCDEEFPTISKAITHKHKFHPDHDAKYFCPWCGKLFTMKHLYNKHIQSVHESKEQSGDGGFHCDYCDVDFFVPSAMLYHNKFFHRQDTELAAIGHSRKLKMFNQETLQVYYCPFCGEEYCNKVNLHKHMGDDHIDENQCPEDVLRCPLCDAVFYHLDAYELHLTFHSTEDIYGQENELTKEITEFSLETVPPVMEKVENELQDDAGNTVGIEELLQQAMNDPNSEPVRGKKKKHKKHKKSKNAAITLDEFLNMNTDVFGEGLDVEGIVEVPTQIVAKSLKRKPGPKPLPAELKKLKKAGLVIKKNPSSVESVKNPNKKPTIRPGLKVAHAGNSNIKSAATPSKPNDASSTDDVLSRLLNKGNSQIKIVKKSAQDHAPEELSTTNKEPFENKNSEMNTESGNSPVGKEKDIGNKSDANKSSNENDSHAEAHSDEGDVGDNNESFKCGDPSDDLNECGIKNNKDNESRSKDDLNVADNSTQSNITVNSKTSANSNQPIPNTLDALRNISQHLTIKSMSSQTNQQKPSFLKEVDVEKDETAYSNVCHDTKAIQGDNKMYSLKPDNSNNINPVKHLSHLTIKPVTQSKNSASPVLKNVVLDKTENHEDMNIDELDNLDDEIENQDTEDDIINTRTQSGTQNQPKRLDALKNLSKQITIKSFSQSPNDSYVDKPSLDQDTDSEIDTGQDVNLKNILLSNKVMMNHQIYKTKGSNVQSPSPNQSPKKLNKLQTGSELSTQKNQITVKKDMAANLTKQFPNVTTKPHNIQKTVNQTMVQTSSQSVNSQKGKIVQNIVKKMEKQEEKVEIFNIDDSDDELPMQPFLKMGPSETNQTLIKNSTQKNEEHKRMDDKSNAVLKNLGKHITIKSSNQDTPIKEELNEETFSHDLDNEFADVSHSIKPQEQRNTVLQNKLKNLCNLTVKSTNTSPKIAAPTPKPKSSKIQMDEFDSDCSNTSEKVKITELPDDYASDDDGPLQTLKSPNLSNKHTSAEEYTNWERDDNEHHEGDDDIESQITPSMLKKPTTQTKKPALLNNLKNITVKSSIDSVNQNEDVSPDLSDENRMLVPYQPQSKTHSNIDRPSSSSQVQRPHQFKQKIGTVNQNISNRVNTVNKEVTVQKFQTKTVVQEITTTVTKTIRTINQSVKQEVRNVAQSSSMPSTPQKIQGMPQTNFRNFKGTPTRPAAPTMGTKIRNAAPTQLPGNCNVRPSNQLVQVRPGVNLARPSYPRKPGPKRFTQPSTSNTLNNSGKPLKIAANAMLSSNKRQATEDPNGPFSCFKKPKESLIPSGDDGVSGMHFASSSQMTKLNFKSTTKAMKGNSVVTSTQMKSEVSARSEQISRLNSMAGLKVVKTSQTKQAVKVEEKSEVSPAKQMTLDAIQKLQMQGLLVKKPKISEPLVEEPDDSEHEYSNPEGDDYCDA